MDVQWRRDPRAAMEMTRDGRLDGTCSRRTTRTIRKAGDHHRALWLQSVFLHPLGRESRQSRSSGADFPKGWVSGGIVNFDPPAQRGSGACQGGRRGFESPSRALSLAAASTASRMAASTEEGEALPRYHGAGTTRPGPRSPHAGRHRRRTSREGYRISKTRTGREGFRARGASGTSRDWYPVCTCGRRTTANAGLIPTGDGDAARV